MRVAHHQFDTDIRHAVLANAETIISFRVGADCPAGAVNRVFSEQWARG